MPGIIEQKKRPPGTLPKRRKIAKPFAVPLLFMITHTLNGYGLASYILPV